MTLPCGKGDHCSRPEPCRLKKDLDKDYRDEAWVEAHCEELLARREGLITVEEWLKKEERSRG